MSESSSSAGPIRLRQSAFRWLQTASSEQVVVMVTITITTSWSWVCWGAFQASSKVQEDVHLLEVVVQGLTTLVSFCLFVLALSLYDFCKQQQYNYSPHGFQKFDFEKKLGSSTLTVSKEHLLSKEGHKSDSDIPLLCEEVATSTSKNTDGRKDDADTQKATNNERMHDNSSVGIRQSKDYDEDDGNMDKLRLPTGQVVGATCIICLCNYEPDEQVSWAAKVPQKKNSLLLVRRQTTSASMGGFNSCQSHQCTHAFHTACFVQYAEVCVQRQRSYGRAPTSIPCPLCRSDFVCI